MNQTLLLEKLLIGTDLNTNEARLLLGAMTEGTISPIQIAAFLAALRAKGETPSEIIGFIRAMREKMTRIQADDAIDVCGTGGDGIGTFNISTAVAFVAAGAGARVVKHGNRAASSRCGSADVLEALGVNIQLTPGAAQKILEKVGIVFLFAPLYHPAMKRVTHIRKVLGVRTIFNMLGPFCNPASVKRQVIGVPNSTIAETLARASTRLSYTHLCIVTSSGMDEANTSMPTTVFEIKGHVLKKFTINPRLLGFKKTLQKSLIGGNAQTNAKIIRNIFQGKHGPARDVVVLNSGIALYVTGIAKNITEGIRKAEASIDSGHAARLLTHLIQEAQSYA